jgi:hypothetical protein
MRLGLSPSRSARVGAQGHAAVRGRATSMHAAMSAYRRTGGVRGSGRRGRHFWAAYGPDWQTSPK